MREFIESDNEKICPRCGSIARVRRLYHLLHTEFLRPGLKILDFSPSRSLYRKMKKGNFNYIASDLSGDFIAGKTFDITDIHAEGHSYDLVICYHVLEHVEDDNQAMKELYRIVKPGGHCIIQTPFKEGDIYEDFSIRSPMERLQHFGQDDHVRIYSVEGLKGRLETAGFKVDLRSFREDSSNIHGYKIEDTILICNI